MWCDPSLLTKIKKEDLIDIHIFLLLGFGHKCWNLVLSHRFSRYRLFINCHCFFCPLCLHRVDIEWFDFIFNLDFKWWNFSHSKRECLWKLLLAFYSISIKPKIFWLFDFSLTSWKFDTWVFTIFHVKPSFKKIKNKFDFG